MITAHIQSFIRFSCEFGFPKFMLIDEGSQFVKGCKRLGRNNNRIPVSPMKVTGNYQKMLEENKKIYNTLFEAWFTSHVPKLMDQPQWFQSSRDVKIGDVLIFIKKDGSLVNTYQYGMIHQLERNKDDLIRKVAVKYRNHNGSVDGFTTRAVRELVLIHPIDKLHLMEELGNIASTNGATMVI